MIEKLAELTFGQLTGYAALLIAVLSTVLEVSKIKVNPWSWLGRKVGKVINGGVISELDGIKGEIGEIKRQNEQQDEDRMRDKALDARRRILQFADEIRREVRHSYEHFTNVSEDISFYEHYCKENPNFENDRAKVSIKIINDTYERCTVQDVIDRIILDMCGGHRFEETSTSSRRAARRTQ